MKFSRIKIITGSLILFTLIFTSAWAKQDLVLQQSNQFEVVKHKEGYITYVVGDVIFKTETGFIYCDSAKWMRGESVVLNGSVIVDDEKYKLTADSVLYDLNNGEILSLGRKVELWSYKDSVFASGTHAFYNEQTEEFYMEERPVMYLGYPDTTAMIEVLADRIDYDPIHRNAQAIGMVKISSNEFSSSSDCAKMNIDTKELDLYEKPRAFKDDSEIKGEFISIIFDDDEIKTIDVIDSAYGHFIEVIDSVSDYKNESILTARRLIIGFDQGQMSNVLAYGEAYNWYYPSARGKLEMQENSASGDTIKFDIYDSNLRKVYVISGATGQYVSSKTKILDSTVENSVDTVDYSSSFIEYDIVDSLITLKNRGHVNSGAVSLDAHVIEFDTRLNTIEAFSADITADTIINPYSISHEIQPNIIPVMLRDGDEQVLGDYLLYSIDSEKGRIVQSKTNYQTGYYYGKDLFREQKEIYYVHDGRYSTCDASEPHYHFHSSNMKMIENNKLIAKPVVFYIERIPILALPYYVFPLQKGRHSGILPFTFGQFERGNRYIKNLGYYWAASEYWDWRGAVDYHEQNKTLNFTSSVYFKKRYIYDGYFRGNYTKVTRYNRAIADEGKTTRWTLQGAYNHTFSPTFNMSASMDLQSDATYYDDYSQNYDDIIDRSITSKISYRKTFGGTSLSGTASHTENLDSETRTDILPINLSFPVLYPFGSGTTNEEGQKVSYWYHKMTFRYSPKIYNYSYRRTVIDDIINTIDTTYEADSVTIAAIDTIPSDTLTSRTRKKYTLITHNPSINLPSIRLGYLMNIIPRISYNESWVKIYETDQSIDASIDASQTYRTYSYSAGVTASTDLYGAIYPNIFGIIGIRHVISPSVSYSYSPELNDHPDIRAFVPGMAGSSKSSLLSFRLGQVFQAKVNHNGQEQTLQLLSISSSFSYNYENDTRPLSDLSTSLSTSSLPIISSFRCNLTHTFYDPETGEENFWSPILTYLSINTSFRLAGNKFFFDEVESKSYRGADSASQLTDQSSSGKKGWALSGNYGYTESGRGSNWSKTSFINFSLSFALTNTVYVSYNQRYNIEKSLTTNNSVSITKKIHCWTGSLFWVPVGTNKGFGFKLFVTDMPEIKLDNNYSNFTQTIQY